MCMFIRGQTLARQHDEASPSILLACSYILFCCISECHGGRGGVDVVSAYRVSQDFLLVERSDILALEV